MTFTLPDALDFAQGAGLILNYHTAYFALKLRGRLREGETVLVHGAAGGVGTAALQVAKGLGASDDRRRLERREGAGRARGRAPTRSCAPTAPGATQAKELTGGGVDVVLDPVGGDRFTDSLRSLREDGPGGRRRLHRRLDPRGAGQPAAAQQHRGRSAPAGAPT